MTAVPTQEQYERFTDMLPASLGDVYIISTSSEPIIFAAFCNPDNHELLDGSVVKGSAFRLWHVDDVKIKNKVLAGIIGQRLSDKAAVLYALNDQETTATQIQPYSEIVRELFIATAYYNLSRRD